MTYIRSYSELRDKAVMWWPPELMKQVAAASPIPLLVTSQDEFISILKLSGKSPLQIFEVLAASEMPANLFVKHLAVMADYGGEPMKRLSGQFKSVFPQNPKETYWLNFVFRENTETYRFEALPELTLSNTALGLDGDALAESRALSPLHQDISMILLHGATSDVSSLANLSKCEIGSLLGEPDLIERYVKERYLHVSRITSGANTNSLGQIAQTYVCEELRSNLSKEFEVKSNGVVKLKNYGKTRGVPFDVVVSLNGRQVGIEVSFQVTTNSTIERKAALAEERQTAMHKSGHHIAYVLDGAGNFERSAALTTLSRYSDCTVAYTKMEIAFLADFIREALNG